MPAASCRIMPARSISRCETISASFGFSFRIGRKNRDNRMGQLRESVGHQKGCSETGSGMKIQGGRPRKSRRKRGFRAISREFCRVGKRALAPCPPFLEERHPIKSVVLIGGHAEPVIGRALSDPVALPTLRT